MTIPYERAFQIIQQSLGSLRRSGLLDEEMTADAQTVVLGSGSTLDSLGFVAFMTDLEDRLNRETNRDIVLSLNAIHDFNRNSRALSIETLARYIGQLTVT